jgi:hypothetical protein
MHPGPLLDALLPLDSGDDVNLDLECRYCCMAHPGAGFEESRHVGLGWIGNKTIDGKTIVALLIYFIHTCSAAAACKPWKKINVIPAQNIVT